MPPTSNGCDAPKIMVLDGGFATQLSCHIGEIVDGDPLWSARFLATQPDAVVKTHLDFLRAGADIIMTNTYQASIEGFMEHLLLSADESIALIKKAVMLAKKACDKYIAEYPEANSKRPLIVGSVGPFGASLHDGSEYSGDYADHVSVETMRDWHRPRIAALVEAGVDILGIETIPALKEAEVLMELLKEFPNIKAWLTFSCKDGENTSHGENFQKSIRRCWELNSSQIVAMGVNCIAPRLVERLFKGINKGLEDNPIPLIVYPNSGENYNPQLGWIDRDKCEPVDIYVRSWLDLGITWIGGCCRTYATDVSRIRSEVTKWQQYYCDHRA